MKKTAFLITLLALIFSLTICAQAASDTYYIEEQEMQITFPSDYYVITRDISDNDLILNYLEISKAEFVRYLEEGDIYLAAFSSDGTSTINIEVTDVENGFEEYALCEDAQLLEMGARLKEDDLVSEYKVYHHSQTKFLVLYIDIKGTSSHAVWYHTNINGKRISIKIDSYEAAFTTAQETELETIIDSIQFEVAPEAPSEPVAYRDQESGVSFSVPAHWEQKALAEGEELLDAKWAYPKSTNIVMIYSSADVWNSLSTIEKITVRRDEMNNDAFSIEQVAEACGISADEVTTVTFGGNEYFRMSMRRDFEISGKHITIPVICLMHVDNGWMYMFHFDEAFASEQRDAFLEVINSVQYPVPPVEPEVSTSEETPEETYSPKEEESGDSTGTVILILVLVFAVIGGVNAAAVVVIIVIVNRKRAKKADTGIASVPIAPEDILRCRNCGLRMLPDSVFCQRCGIKLKKEE